MRPSIGWIRCVLHRKDSNLSCGKPISCSHQGTTEDFHLSLVVTFSVTISSNVKKSDETWSPSKQIPRGVIDGASVFKMIRFRKNRVDVV